MEDMMDPIEPIRITVFERSAACACRPGEQRGWMALKATLHGVRKEFDDKVAIEYHTYDRSPEEFHRNPQIAELLQAEGLEILPITAINGEIRKRGSLPTLKELRALIAPNSV
jgi:hypothetical protein